MKIKHSLLGFLLISIIWSCRKPEKEPDPVPVISVNRSAFQIGQLANHTDTFVVESNVNWKLAQASTHLQVSPLTGTPGKTTVTVKSLGTATINHTAMIRVTPEGNVNTPAATVSVNYKVYSLDWQKTIGGTSYDYVSSIIPATDGGYVFCGETSSNNTGDIGVTKGLIDMLLVKQDASGNIIWKTTVGGSGTDMGTGVAVTADGGYIVAGSTDSEDNVEETGNNINGNSDMLIVKFDASGHRQWSKRYGGAGDDYGVSILTTAGGDYVVTGHTSSSNSDNGEIGTTKGSFDVWIMKLDGSGDWLWSTTYGGAGEDFSQNMVATADGGYMICATAAAGSGDVPAGPGAGDIWLLKLNASGILLWSKTYGGSYTEIGGRLVVDPDGNFVVCGYTSSDATGDVPAAHGNTDTWVFKVDAQGNKLWSKIFGGNNYDRSFGLAANPDGTYFVGGESSSNDNGDVPSTKGGSDVWLLRLDSRGNVMWREALGGNRGDYVYTMLTSPDGSVVVGAVTDSNNSFAVPPTNGGSEIWILKFKPY